MSGRGCAFSSRICWAVSTQFSCACNAIGNRRSARTRNTKTDRLFLVSNIDIASFTGLGGSCQGQGQVPTGVSPEFLSPPSQGSAPVVRSEEHTSELQSLAYI